LTVNAQAMRQTIRTERSPHSLPRQGVNTNTVKNPVHQEPDFTTKLRADFNETTCCVLRGSENIGLVGQFVLYPKEEYAKTAYSSRKCPPYFSSKKVNYHKNCSSNTANTTKKSLWVSFMISQKNRNFRCAAVLKQILPEGMRA
jgi:hypothetical protein